MTNDKIKQRGQDEKRNSSHFTNHRLSVDNSMYNKEKRIKCNGLYKLNRKSLMTYEHISAKYGVDYRIEAAERSNRYRYVDEVNENRVRSIDKVERGRYGAGNEVDFFTTVDEFSEEGVNPISARWGEQGVPPEEGDVALRSYSEIVSINEKVETPYQVFEDVIRVDTRIVVTNGGEDHLAISISYIAPEWGLIKSISLKDSSVFEDEEIMKDIAENINLEYANYMILTNIEEDVAYRDFIRQKATVDGTVKIEQKPVSTQGHYVKIDTTFVYNVEGVGDVITVLLRADATITELWKRYIDLDVLFDYQETTRMSEKRENVSIEEFMNGF